MAAVGLWGFPAVGYELRGLGRVRGWVEGIGAQIGARCILDLVWLRFMYSE